MSKEVVTTYRCDMCGEAIGHYDKDQNRPRMPVRFITEQNEGTLTDPYMDYVEIDLCDKCLDRALVIDACGAMGHNDYSWRDE